MRKASILDTIFSNGHQPETLVGRGMYHLGQAVSFPTQKTWSGIIRARSLLMADGLLHLDTDVGVAQLSAYPMTVSYWSTRDGKTPVKRLHTPDLAIRMTDGSVTFIDYVTLNEQQAKPYFWRRHAERVRHYQNELGCAFAVHDERSVRIEPRLSNLRLMWTHRSRPTEPPSLAHAREAIRMTSLPSTIRAISEMAMLSRQAVHWEEDDEPVLLEGVDLIFTAVMQMAMLGEVRVDLGKRINLDSIVYGGAA
ncbi:hypothetical protein HFO43_09570 [Rhizobium leguminosarum]|uniref:hypothetical protein n=1 Tax=Rhizobium leguminosarum TaxID=384 RepID=UPI0010305FEF|nr:hypothetical protein [Rhizobium leguminosarum]MBY5668791.1 hypothetical protein [Rhizobium leguminosarum]TAX09574.1 hypothetical protein ELI07_08720 [Rhizobium leguminosarum]